jgi:hypothetical protein
VSIVPPTGENHYAYESDKLLIRDQARGPNRLVRGVYAVGFLEMLLVVSECIKLLSNKTRSFRTIIICHRQGEIKAFFSVCARSVDSRISAPPPAFGAGCTPAKFPRKHRNAIFAGQIVPPCCPDAALRTRQPLVSGKLGALASPDESTRREHLI